MPDRKPLVIEESSSLSTTAAYQRQVQRLSRFGRKMTPPGGLRSPQEVRAHWLQRADEMDRWAETPAEARAATDYRARIEAASETELWTEYLPFADGPNYEGTPAAWWI